MPVDPAHTILRVVPPSPVSDPEAVAAPPPPPPDTADWLIAESWWAQDFRPAAFVELLRWGLGVGPWMLLRYVGLETKGLHHGPQPGILQWLTTYIVRFWSRVLQIAIAFAAAILVQLVMLALLVLSIVPQLRGVVAVAQRRLTGSFGDPYILAVSPLRFDAMVAKVQRDLAWLRKAGCEDIAVVAHSQGTAIAHEALWTNDCPRVNVFITFGNAIKKLFLMRRLADREALLLVCSIGSTVGITAALAGLIGRFVSGSWDDPYPWWLLAGGGIVGYFVGVTVPVIGLEQLAEQHLRLNRLHARGLRAWHDYYAANDPFPEGRLPFPRIFAPILIWCHGRSGTATRSCGFIRSTGKTPKDS